MNKMKHGDKHDDQDDDDLDDDGDGDDDDEEDGDADDDDEDEEDEEDEEDVEDEDADEHEQVNTTSCKPDDFLPLARERYHPHKALNPVRCQIQIIKYKYRIPLKLKPPTTHTKLLT